MNNDVKYVIKLENGTSIGKPLGFENLKYIFPEIIFSEDPTISELENFGYAKWIPTQQIQTNDPLVKCVEKNCVWNEELNSFEQTWELIPLEGDELQERINLEWKVVNNLGGALLDEAQDILSSADISLTEEQQLEITEYIQKLQNVIPNANDPFNIIWPKSILIKSIRLEKIKKTLQATTTTTTLFEEETTTTTTTTEETPL